MIAPGHWSHAARAPLRRLASAITSHPATPARGLPANVLRHAPFCTYSKQEPLASSVTGLKTFTLRRFDQFHETARAKGLVANHIQKRTFLRPSSPRLHNNNNNAAPGTGSAGANAGPAGVGASKSLLGHQAATAGPTAAVSASVKAAERAANAEQNKLDWKIFKELSSYIWPKDDRGVKIRVVAALSLLVMGKLLNVQVPFFFKDIIDKLNVDFPVEATALSVVGA
ncbi:Iron-sulfur clusters transporter atm1, mitochondrial, partial [Mortierella alpina]